MLSSSFGTQHDLFGWVSAAELGFGPCHFVATLQDCKLIQGIGCAFFLAGPPEPQRVPTFRSTHVFTSPNAGQN